MFRPELGSPQGTPQERWKAMSVKEKSAYNILATINTSLLGELAEERFNEQKSLTEIHTNPFPSWWTKFFFDGLQGYSAETGSEVSFPLMVTVKDSTNIQISFAIDITNLLETSHSYIHKKALTLAIFWCYMYPSNKKYQTLAVKSVSRCERLRVTTLLEGPHQYLSSSKFHFTYWKTSLEPASY